MEWLDVATRIAGGENETTELKEWSSEWKDKVGAALAAMANGVGGVVIVGVADDGTISGVAADPEEVQEKLTSFLQTGLSAPVRARLGSHRTPSGWVHWIEVLRSRGPTPFKRGGRVYMRRGRASVEASDAELQDLYNRLGFVLTEEQIVDGAAPSDVDVARFHAFLAKQGIDAAADPQPAIADDLRNGGVLISEDGEDRVTMYGLLCFGRAPQRAAPLRNACVAMTAYAGTDRAARVLLAADALGDVDDQVVRALDWTKALGHTEEMRGIFRVDRPLLPERALREALVNAVAHRDYAILGSRVLLDVYDDRVEIISPGELPNHMTEAAVLRGGVVRRRNQAVAHFLQVMGLMESRGRGLPILRKELLAFNGREPVLENDRDGRFVRLILPR